MTAIEIFLAVTSVIAPFVFYGLGHYHGYKWGRRNPEKIYLEYFFEVEKKEQP